MKLSISIAKQLLLLAGGEQLPASSIKGNIANELIAEDIVQQRIAGRSKRTLYIRNATALAHWLFNTYGINDLAQYIETLSAQESSRATSIAASGNSKLRNARTFKGFLVNSYEPVQASLNGVLFTIHPPSGSFQFISDYEHFTVPPDVVIVGIENAENFRWIERQRYLFADIHTLFVCRYPQEQSKDLLKWLLSIPNPYLHFGDYDLAAINIYMQEYKQHLGERASFFIPGNIEALLTQYGNKGLYNQQQLNSRTITEEPVVELIALLHKHKKALEQEIFIRVK